MSGVDERRRRVIELCLGLPEAAAREGQHVKFTVRDKTFAYWLDDHHGDGIVAISVKAAPGVQQALVAADPERYLVPSYLGPRGWVSLRVDTPEVDWAEIEDLLVDSYRLVAPKRLAQSL